MKVTYKDHMGSDLQVVNCARVSFDKESEMIEDSAGWRLSDRDKNLIQFLARGCTTGEWDQLCMWAENGGMSPEELQKWRKTPRHWVPFANGGTILLHFKVPIFVARQLQKHQAGFEPQSEVSRRYVDSEPELYWPDNIRSKADNVKQGSGDRHPTINHGVGTGYYGEMKSIGQDMITYYKYLLDQNVCEEQARMILPQNMYTEYFWKGNLYAWASLYNTRMDPHTQKETREVVKQIGEIIEPLYPISWKALTWT